MDFFSVRRNTRSLDTCLILDQVLLGCAYPSLIDDTTKYMRDYLWQLREVLSFLNKEELLMKDGICLLVPAAPIAGAAHGDN